MEKLVSKLHRLFNENSLYSESGKLTYGTSGYRCRAELLVGVAARIGAYACLHSIHHVSFNTITTHLH